MCSAQGSNVFVAFALPYSGVHLQEANFVAASCTCRSDLQCARKSAAAPKASNVKAKHMSLKVIPSAVVILVHSTEVGIPSSSTFRTSQQAAQLNSPGRAVGTSSTSFQTACFRSELRIWMRALRTRFSVITVAQSGAVEGFSLQRLHRQSVLSCSCDTECPGVA